MLNLKKSETVKVLMSTVKTIGNNNIKSFIIKFNPDNIYDCQDWEILARSFIHNKGHIKFDGDYPDNSFELSIKGDSFCSYEKLSRILDYKVEMKEILYEEHKEDQEVFEEQMKHYEEEYK